VGGCRLELADAAHDAFLAGLNDNPTHDNTVVTRFQGTRGQLDSVYAAHLCKTAERKRHP
jgi:hypothetical protein